MPGGRAVAPPRQTVARIGAAALVELDPDSGYHLGQIAGMVLLYHAIAGSGARSDAFVGRELPAPVVS